MQDLLSGVLQLLGAKHSSPTRMAAGPALTPAEDIDGCSRQTGMVTSLHTQDSENDSHTLVLTGLALLPSPGKVKRLLSGVLHLVDAGDSSLNLLITGPALPFASGIDGSWGEE